MHRKSAKKKFIFSNQKFTKPAKIFLKTEKSLKRFLAAAGLCLCIVPLRTASTLCRSRGIEMSILGKVHMKEKKKKKKKKKLVGGRN